MFALSLVVFCNLNAVALVFTEELGSISWVIALFVLILVAINFHDARTVLQLAGWPYFLFIFLYVLLGSLSSSFYGWREDWGALLFTNAANLALVAAYSSGTYFLGKHEQFNYAIDVLLRIMTAMAVLVVFSPILNDFMANVENFGADNRHAGLFINPNVAASFCCVGLALSLARTAKLSITSLLQVAIFIVATFTTYSKAGILSLIIISVTYLLRATTTKEVTKVAVSISVAVPVFLLFLLLAIELEAYTLIDLSIEQERRIETVKLILNTGILDDETTTHRAGIAELAIEQWLTSPIFGVGIGSMRLLSGSDLGVHNNFLLILGESGIVPTAAMLWICVAGLAWGWSKFSIWQGRFVFCYTIVFILSCLSSHNILEDRFHNAFIGICIGIVALWRNRVRV
jgi:O-antigen ligase